MTLLQSNSLNETGYKAYIEYLALKRHFTTKYDYHKYNGKVKASFDNFLVRKDAFTFQRLGKKKEYKELLLSNIVINPKIWIGQILDDASRKRYLEWKKIQDSITKHIEDQLENLDNDFQENFVVQGGDYPYILDLYLRKKISLETITLLTKITNSKSYWESNVMDKVIFPSIMTKIDKYYPFIEYDNQRVTKVIKDHFF